MTVDQDQALDEEPQAADAAPGAWSISHRMFVVAKIAGAIAATAGVAWIVRLMMGNDAAQLGWWWQVLLATVASLSCVLVLLRQWNYYHRPIREFAGLVGKIRAGEVPIEALSKVEGCVLPIISTITDLLRESRQKSAKIAELELEMVDRVARRTDKLERQMGTFKLQATLDKLTGLYNRRALDELLPTLIARCRRDVKPLALLMLDVDNFKRLNDTKGHAAGDDFLRSVGQLIRSSIRPEDYGFRCGGDELVVVLPDCSKSGAESLLKRLTELGDALGKSAGSIPPARLSIGCVTLYDLVDPKSETLLAEADRRLYEIKQKRKSPRAA